MEGGEQGFRTAMEVNAKLAFNLLEPEGTKNFERIPPQKPLVLALPHFSDADVQIAAYWLSLSERFKQARPGRTLGIALGSENYANPVVRNMIKMIGEEHFFPISTKKNAEGRWDFSFNPEDFAKMAKAMQEGTDIIMAAHEPLANIPNAPWELPARAGVGAAYLSELTGATVLPMAVDIHTETPTGYTAHMPQTVRNLIRGQRPDAQLIIGEPMIPPMVSEEERVRLASRQPREVYKDVRSQANTIMDAIAQLLPPEKRGKWGEKE